MALLERILLAWRHEAPAGVRALAALGLAGGVSCELAAAFPPNPQTPVTALRLVGILILAGSLLTLWLGGRLPAWGMHLLVATGTVSTSVIVARSVTGVGMIVASCAYLWIAIYVNFFFSQSAARLHTALITASFAVAVLLSRISVPVDAWLFMTVSVVVAGETVGRQSERLRHEAHTDALTGLLNRKGLGPAAERALSLADRTAIPITVALVDLDDFKLVNDRDGHHEGDRLLIRMAQVWKEELEPSDIFARLGGDEFVLLLLGSGARESSRLFERLRFISPTAWSAGTVSRRPGEDLSSCLKRADASLYETKRSRLPERPAAPRAARRPAARLDSR